MLSFVSYLGLHFYLAPNDFCKLHVLSGLLPLISAGQVSADEVTNTHLKAKKNLIIQCSQGEKKEIAKVIIKGGHTVATLFLHTMTVLISLQKHVNRIAYHRIIED